MPPPGTCAYGLALSWALLEGVEIFRYRPSWESLRHSKIVISKVLLENCVFCFPTKACLPRTLDCFVCLLRESPVA